MVRRWMLIDSKAGHGYRFFGNVVRFTAGFIVTEKVMLTRVGVRNVIAPYGLGSDRMVRMRGSLKRIKPLFILSIVQYSSWYVYHHSLFEEVVEIDSFFAVDDFISMCGAIGIEKLRLEVWIGADMSG